MDLLKLKLEQIISNWTRKYLTLKIIFPKELFKEIEKFYDTYKSQKLKITNKLSNKSLEVYSTGRGSAMVRLNDPLPNHKISKWTLSFKKTLAHHRGFPYAGEFFGIISNLDDAQINYQNSINPRMIYEWKSIYGIDAGHYNYYKSPLKDWTKVDISWDRYTNIKLDDVIEIIADFRDINDKVLQFKINDEYIKNSLPVSVFEFKLPNKTSNGEINKHWYPLFGLYDNSCVFCITFEKDKLIE